MVSHARDPPHPGTRASFPLPASILTDACDHPYPCQRSSSAMPAIMPSERRDPGSPWSRSSPAMPVTRRDRARDPHIPPSRACVALPAITSTRSVSWDDPSGSASRPRPHCASPAHARSRVAARSGRQAPAEPALGRRSVAPSCGHEQGRASAQVRDGEARQATTLNTEGQVGIAARVVCNLHLGRRASGAPLGA